MSRPRRCVTRTSTCEDSFISLRQPNAPLHIHKELLLNKGVTKRVCHTH